MPLYHVDRANTLTAGQIIDYRQANLASDAPDYLKTGIEKFFEGGISRHGQEYLQRPILVSGNPITVESDTYLEVILELIRQKMYPDLPSRYQSFFAYGSIDQAKAWFNPNLPYITTSIWEVESEKSCKFDIGWLKTGRNVAESFHYAINYWEGNTYTEAPEPEYLLKLPVKVIRRVQ